MTIYKVIEGNFEPVYYDTLTGAKTHKIKRLLRGSKAVKIESLEIPEKDFIYYILPF